MEFQRHDTTSVRCDRRRRRRTIPSAKGWISGSNGRPRTVGRPRCSIAARTGDEKVSNHADRIHAPGIYSRSRSFAHHDQYRVPALRRSPTVCRCLSKGLIPDYESGSL
ncbi:hypothetical protein C731_2873 [Mycolicibacterium hassiacum DSM 44199]|uniref:Uncharacterized protein n=1 Tax=Mycolicibacterium hassiacum (strain DSM 44199 / CIP 105218 / JCM 12690 / 3849) TaxID=1122247 RepID=K5BFF6_MYCHD|nr:hypothetical protein C731_2873 [Mycolicibacterium hassiacum DSM 44199]